MVRKYSKGRTKRFRRRRKRGNNIYRRLKRLEKAAINPWSITRTLWGQNIESAQNRYGWAQYIWGSAAEWVGLWDSTPYGMIGTSVAATGGTNFQHTSTAVAAVPNAAPVQDAWAAAAPTSTYTANMLLHTVVTWKYTIVNNQEYPVSLTIYKGFCKNNWDHSPLSSLDRAINQATIINNNLAVSTLTKNDLTFSWKDLDKDNAFNEGWKITKRQAIKLNPGDVVKFTHSINARVNASDLRSIDGANAYINGRAMFVMFKSMGPIGKIAGTVAPDNVQPGILGTNLQATRYQIVKHRWENTTVPPVKNINKPNIATVAPPTSLELQPDGAAMRAVYPGDLTLQPEQ